MIHAVPPSASSATMLNEVFAKSIACEVGASHCRGSDSADMDDMLMKRWATSKRHKPSANKDGT